MFSAPHGLAEIVDRFGDPRPLLNANGMLDPDEETAWRKTILAERELPFPIPLSMSAPTPVKTHVWAHRLLVDHLVETFEDIARAGLQAEIKSWGGVYNFRAARKLQKLSAHAWGIAVDLNPETNKLGIFGDMDARIVEIFRARGFTWGGDFKRIDPMHFQFATGY